MKRLRFIAALFVAFGSLLFATPAHADDLPQVSVTISTEGNTTTTEVLLDTAAEDLSVITTTLTNTENIAATLSPTTSVSESLALAVSAVNEAIANLTAAESALTVVGEKEDALEAAQAAKSLAQTNLTAANSALTTAQNTVTTKTEQVSTQQGIVNTEQAELNALQSNGYTYTTNGYVAPTPSPSSSPTQTILPDMWDAATKIDVPFDIKLGNTLYEGQGDASQIYVTSKATITFGAGDFDYWSIPDTANIAVFHSDWMTAGVGAYAKVTTTDTTLQVEWSLHRFADNSGPLTSVIWNMTVNPATGEWTGHSSISGNTNSLWNGPGIGVRETNNGVINSMAAAPTSADVAQAISSQKLVVQTENEKLQTLISEKNAAVLVVSQKQTLVVTAQGEVTQATTAEQIAVSQLASAVTTSNTLTQTAIISVTNAETAVTTTYTIVNAEKIAQTPPPYTPQPSETQEPVVDPTPEPTSEPTVDPTPAPTGEPTSEPTVDPTPAPTGEPTPAPTGEPTPTPEETTEPVVEPTENEPEPLPEPEPPAAPEALVEELTQIAPEELTDAQVEQLVEAALEVFETAEAGSPEYEQALEALAVAAQADDVELPAELAAIPLLGNVAAAALEFFNDLGNFGADMSPQQREKAEETVIGAVIVGQVAQMATAAAAAAGASAAASSSASTRKIK